MFRLLFFPCLSLIIDGVWCTRYYMSQLKLHDPLYFMLVFSYTAEVTHSHLLPLLLLLYISEVTHNHLLHLLVFFTQLK